MAQGDRGPRLVENKVRAQDAVFRIKYIKVKELFKFQRFQRLEVIFP